VKTATLAAQLPAMPTPAARCLGQFAAATNRIAVPEATTVAQVTSARGLTTPSPWWSC